VELTQVLVVDDEPPVLRAFRRMLPPQEFAVHTADCATAALALAGRRSFDIAIVDLMLPEMSGLEVLERLRRGGTGTEVIMMTAYGAIPDAVAALRGGARDFLEKPFADPAELLALLRRAAAERRAAVAPAGPAPSVAEAGLVGTSRRMGALFETIEAAAPSRASVLVQGESGTGKELVARALHARSGRRGPFVAVNCSALPETLLESELFGHARGAFTGAVSAKRGLFEEAHRGTLLLDEIGDMPPAVQVKLLRALQEGEIRPLGQNEAVRVDVRVVAATHVDLEAAITGGRFREDLYYRLAVITLTVPPLRERSEDIAGLARHFLERAAAQGARRIETIDGAALQLLRAHRWAGNVRELENVIERAAVLGRGPVLTVADLPPALRSEAPREERRAGPPYLRLDYRRAREAALAVFERSYASALLQRTAGNLSEAARQAGLDRSNLKRVLRRCGVLPGEFRDRIRSPDP
jgi:DNA-binding NtrC family response regulator